MLKCDRFLSWSGREQYLTTTAKLRSLLLVRGVYHQLPLEVIYYKASEAEVQRMLLELRQLSVPPGQRVLLHDVSWQELEAILEELGEHRAARIAYDNGTLTQH